MSISGKDQNTPVINSNIHNYCSPHKFAQAGVTRINPDKFTFLKSNLLVSNILNSKIVPPSPSALNESINANKDAYGGQQCKDDEVWNDRKIEEERKCKIDRTRQLAKCRSQTAFSQFREKEQHISKEIQMIHQMREDMGDKARQILGRKDNNAYLGRSIFVDGEKFLKSMKKSQKTEATRLIMRQNMKKKIQKSSSARFITNEEEERHERSSNTNSSVMNTSQMQELNCNAHQQKIQKEQQDQVLRKLFKCRSEGLIWKQQKRRAAWDGFAEHWSAGFSKNEGTKVMKKKRKIRKSLVRQTQLSPVAKDKEEVLSYDSRMSRQLALKRYSNMFSSTANSFKIQCG